MSNNDDTWGCLIAIVAVVAIALGWLVDADWLNKLRYAFTEHIHFSRVAIDKKPHDCDFLTAPFGAKNCHYEKVATKVVRAAAQDGSPIVSLDGGKTWETHAPGKCYFDPTIDCPNGFDTPEIVSPKYRTPGALVEWKKVQD